MKRKNGQKSGHRGFSLVELLMVLAVLGILAGIGGAGVKGLRRWMAESESRSLFIELATACRLYRMDHGTWPAGLLRGEVALNGSDPSWKAALAPYLERRIWDRKVVDGFGHEALYLIVDADGDHWIAGSSFEALPTDQRPGRIWARTAVYSLDAENRLAAWSWQDE